MPSPSRYWCIGRAKRVLISEIKQIGIDVGVAPTRRTLPAGDAARAGEANVLIGKAEGGRDRTTTMPLGDCAMAAASRQEGGFEYFVGEHLATLHQTMLVGTVIADGAMPRAQVVPHQHVAHAPPVRVTVFRLQDVGK